ncbi:hypothetical protein A3862_16175 [Methylobacterium sp. XJLW]|uniref:recombinase family protein n=1 Tax=Methylobacterium sp. XJLW TaxID=739141 RepID=UPI000DAAE885|nr:recombinase family protein [Methylobacterium sp. XJLW]AWV16848.1 hypothetical protein A3862_16175 [Methylobacterium sp. XJLW]
MPKAYSYLRFSTPEQAKGDSSRRQTALARDYALRHGLDLDEKLTFEDLGVSAFRGRNAETGRLSEFLEAVKDGTVPQGSYLLVESLDRISRQAARKALRALENIVEAGITVVTLSDGKAYTADGIDDDPMSLMLALMIFIRSNEESATKSRRLKAAWANKRDTAGSRPLTARAPAWLEMTPDRTWRVREDRAAVVRRIFAMAAEGSGEHAITAALNRDGVPPFGNGSRVAAHWHRTSIIKILDNPAAGGVLQPYTQEHVEGRKVRTRQAPVEGHFPVIVDDETRETVRALRASSNNPQRGRHAAGEIRNMLAGLARCPMCGGTMTRVSKGAKAKAGRPSLVCTKAKAGGGCRYRAVRLDHVEGAIQADADWLFQVRSIDGPYGSLGDPLEKVREAIQKAEARRDNLVRAIAEGSTSPTLGIALVTEEKAIEVFRGRELELLRTKAVSDHAAVSRRFDELRGLLADHAPDRHRVNVLLRQSLSSVTVHYGTGFLIFKWKDSGETVIKYDERDDHTRAPEEWQVEAKRLTEELPAFSTPMTEEAYFAVTSHPLSVERSVQRVLAVPIAPAGDAPRVDRP